MENLLYNLELNLDDKTDITQATERFSSTGKGEYFYSEYNFTISFGLFDYSHAENTVWVEDNAKVNMLSFNFLPRNDIHKVKIEARSGSATAIYKDKTTGKYIFIEAKETAGKGNYALKFGEARYGQQMSAQWLEYHIERASKKGKIDSITRDDLLSSLRSGNIEKYGFIYHYSGAGYGTISEGFASHLGSIPGKVPINVIIVFGR